jgi:hypothetical protein
MFKVFLIIAHRLIIEIGFFGAIETEKQKRIASIAGLFHQHFYLRSH